MATDEQRAPKKTFRDMFTKRHTGKSAAPHSAADSNDPIEPTPLVIDIDRIETYTHNPRRVPNPQYAAIKTSIARDGLHQPLVITRRPDAAHYMLLRGGNTRLRALQELVRESGEPRFRRIQCLFEPWSGESSALLGHLIENDTRGDLTFLDRARAINELKAFIEQDLETELSQRRLATLLRERGYRISPILISQMTYALSVLAPALPQAFEGGLGGDRVQRLRALEHAGLAVWRRYKLGASERYQAVFREILRRSDTPNWRFEPTQQSLVDRLAEYATVAAKQIQVALDAEFANAPLPPRGTPNQPASSLASESSPTPATAASAAHSAQPHEASGRGNIAHSDPAEHAEPHISSAPAHATQEIPDTPTPAIHFPDDIKSLRARAWTLATKLAKHYHFDALIQPLPNRGLGYVVVDVIDPATVAEGGTAEAGERGTLWWHLVACAELTCAPVQDLRSILRADGVLLQALREGDLVQLLDVVPTYHISQLAAVLWARMDDPRWRDLLALMETHRQLRAIATRDQVPLWSAEAGS